MSGTSSSFNPYEVPRQEGFKPPPPKPGQVKAIGIIALILAAFGVMSGAMQLIGTLFSQVFQSLATPMAPGNDPQLARLQQDMQQELLDMQSHYMPIQATLAVLLFFVAAGLLAASILLLKHKQIGRKMMLVVCPLVIMIDIARGVVQSVFAFEQTKISARFVEQLTSATGGQNGPPPGMVSAFATAFAVVFIVFGACWVLMKVIFYLIAVFYLRRSHIAQLFN